MITHWIVRLMLIGFIASASIAHPKDPLFYTKKSTWYGTMFASKLWLADEARDFEKQRGIICGPWYAIGPFTSAPDSSFVDSFEPEREIALQKSYDQGTKRWVQRSEWKDGVVTDLGRFDFSSTYLYRSIRSDRDTVIRAFLGSDDGIKVWINDSLILAHDVYRGCGPNQEEASVALRRGENVFLMKINNGRGAYAFYFSLFPYTSDDVWFPVERDFTDPIAQTQMSRERADGIWEGTGSSFDLAALAAAYVRATRFESRVLHDEAIRHAGEVKSWKQLEAVRKRYHASIDKEFVILTPRPAPTPRINGPEVFGVRPGAPFLFTIPATGVRPIAFEAKGLPEGLTLDSQTGRMTGVLHTNGEYLLTLRAKNSRGTTERSFRIVVGSTIVLTPPLGWNSWNCFANAVDDRKVRSAADAMVKSGLIDHGWSYINIDDCWMIRPGVTDTMVAGMARDADGMINANKKFPDMKALSDYVHGKGLKLGIYSSPGPLTCAGFTACYGYEEQDARRFAQWGIDYLKYDWCSYETIAKDNSLAELQKPYRVMRQALDKVNRDIVYSLCQYGMGNVWEWGADVGGNCWRTTGDISDTWKSMAGIGFEQNGHERWAGPGHWNDPDMLVVGLVGWGEYLHPTGLSGNEQYTHISLWALLASPLLIGCDMTRMDEFTQGLLTNDEVLDVNQDPLGVQVRRVSRNGDAEAWAKKMEDGSMAVGLFNRGDYRSDVSTTWSALELTGRHRVRDLWRQKELGTYARGFTASVPRHGVVLVRIF